MDDFQTLTGGWGPKIPFAEHSSGISQNKYNKKWKTKKVLVISISNFMSLFNQPRLNVGYKRDILHFF